MDLPIEELRRELGSVVLLPDVEFKFQAWEELELADASQILRVVKDPQNPLAQGLGFTMSKAERQKMRAEANAAKLGKDPVQEFAKRQQRGKDSALKAKAKRAAADAIAAAGNDGEPVKKKRKVKDVKTKTKVPKKDTKGGKGKGSKKT